MPSFIDDGYTRDDGYIAGAPAAKSGERLWDSMSFTYRIATRAEVIRHDSEIRAAMKGEDDDPECALNAEKLACKFVAERMKSWDLKNRGNHSVPVSADGCARLNGSLFGRLYRIVRGADVSDPKPPETIPPTGDEELQKN